MSLSTRYNSLPEIASIIEEDLSWPTNRQVRALVDPHSIVGRMARFNEWRASRELLSEIDLRRELSAVAFFSELLHEGRVCMAPPNFEGPKINPGRDRADIKYANVQIEPEATLPEISAEGLLKYYVPEFRKPDFKGIPVHSGNVGTYDGSGVQSQVFYPCHTRVRPDGGFDRLVPTTRTVRHGGSLELENASVSLRVELARGEKSPSPEAIKTVTFILAHWYSELDIIVDGKRFGSAEELNRLRRRLIDEETRRESII